jgi:hypothetical protein
MNDLIPISRIISDQILINKHDIRDMHDIRGQHKLINGIPIVDSNNPEHIEEITGNQLRVLKAYPAGNDFCLNIIAKAKKEENEKQIVAIEDYNENYYRISLTEETFFDYFNHCRGRDVKHNLIKQLINPFSDGIIMIRGGNQKGSYLSVGLPPFRIYLKKYDGINMPMDIKVELLKAVYGSLIDDDCFRKGGDGYYQIPEYLYALCTQTEKGCLQSYNPIYKAQIVGIKKNTNKKDRIFLDREELLRNIAPEYLFADGRFKNRAGITIVNFENAINSQAETLVRNNRGNLLVGSINIGFSISKNFSTLYFTDGNNSNYSKKRKDKDNKALIEGILKKLQAKKGDG